MKRKTKIFALIGSSAACVALFLTSTIVGMEEDKNESKPFVAYGLDIEDEDSQYLGYGYDVTAGKAISDPDALNLAYPILDVNNPELAKYEKAFSSSQTTYQSFSSKSANEIASEYGLTLGGGISAKIAKVDVSIETKFNTNTTFNKKVEEEYSYYTIYAKNRTVLFQAGTDVFSQYLHPDFLKSVSKMSSAQDAELVYQKYGTHLVTGYNLGGIFEMTNYFATCSTSYVRQNTTSFSSQVSAAFGAYGAGVGFSFSQNYGSLDNNSFAVNNYKCTTYGGYTFPGLTIDQAFSFYQTAFGAGYIYGLWTDSINAGKNLSIVSIPQSSAMIPLYNLLPDGHEYDDARSYLVEAYIKRCGISYSKFMASHPDVNPNVKPTTISPNDIGYSGYGYEEFCLLEGENKYSSTYVSSDDYKGTISTTPGHIISFDFDRSLYEGRSLVWEFAPSSGLSSKVTILDDRNGVIKINKTASAGELILRLKFDDTQIYSVNINIAAASTYGGGAGTTSNPYLISTAQHLYALMSRSQDWNLAFKLTADINLDNGSSGFNSSIRPIGRVVSGTLKPFTGIFDGNFHSIRHYRLYLNNLDNVYITTDGTNSSNSKYNAMGMFGVNTGQITNLTVDMGTLDQNASYDNNKNIIANYKYDYTVLNNKKLDEISDGDITNNYSDSTSSKFSKAVSIIGGIVGQNSGKVTNCHVENLDLRFVDVISGKGVSHPMQVGLICGYNTNNGVVDECSAKESTIRGYTYATDKTSNVSFLVGGIIGENRSTKIVTKCSIDKVGIDTFVRSNAIADNNALITKEFNVGGIIGYSYSPIEDCMVANIDSSLTNASSIDPVSYSFKTGTDGKSGATGSICKTALFVGNSNKDVNFTRCVAYRVNSVVNRVKISVTSNEEKSVYFGTSNYTTNGVTYNDCVLEENSSVTFADKDKSGLSKISNAKYSNLPEVYTSSDCWESDDVTEYPQIVYEKLDSNGISFDFSKAKKYFAYDGTKVESFQAGQIIITALSSTGDEVEINEYDIDCSDFDKKINNSNNTVELGTANIYVTALNVTASYQVYIVETNFVGIEATFNNVINPDYYAGDLLNPQEITVKKVMADGTRKDSYKYKGALDPTIPSDIESLNKRMYFEIEDVDKPLVAGVNNFNVSFYDINSGKTYTTVYSIYAKRSDVSSVSAVENTDANIAPLAVGKKEVTPDDLAGLEVEVSLTSVSDEIDARIIETSTPRKLKLVFDEVALSRGKIIVSSLNGSSYLTKEIDSSEVEVISSPIVFGQNRVQICYGGYLDANKTEINVLGTYQDLTSYFDEYKALIDTYFDGDNYSETSASMAPLRTRFEIIKDALALKEKLSSLSGDTEYVHYTQKLDILIADYNADIGAVNLVVENIVKSPTSFYYNSLSNSGYLVLPLLIALLFLII